MSQNCVCGVGLSDLGTPNCIKEMGRPYKLVFAQLKDSTGADNVILSTDTIDQTYLDGKVANLDVTQRWFVSPEVKEFLSTKEDSVFQDFDDGSREEIREGRRSFTGLFKYADEKVVEYLRNVKCAKSGFYIITDKGNIVGYNKDNSGNVYPLPVDVLVPILNFKTGDAIQNVSFTLDIPVTLFDSELATVYGATADLKGAEGLVKLATSVSAETVTGFDLLIKGDGQYGYIDGYEGLATGDLTVYNVTLAASGSVGTVTDNGSGSYTLALTGVGTGETAKISPAQPLLDAGFSFDEFEVTLA